MSHGSGSVAAGAEPGTAADEVVADIGTKAARGLSWSLFGTMVVKIGSFAVSIAAVRLLDPSDYGTYAVALAALHFVMTVHDAGLVGATVQWRGRIEEMSATALTLTLGLSVVMYAGFWILAGPFAQLAGVPEAAGVVRVVTAAILIHGVTAISAGVILREFRTGKLIQANFAGFLVTGATTISLAVAGAGPYSLAWGNVCGEVATGVLVLIWGRVPLRLGFDRAVARRLLAFGLPLAGALGIGAIIANADYVIVGNLLGQDSLGFYLLACNIAAWIPSIVGTAVGYVSFASFSRLSEKDTATLNAGVQRSVPLLMTVVVPVAVLIGVLAGPLITVLYGSGWGPSTAVLQVLMSGMAVRMLVGLALDVVAGAGAARPSLWINLCTGAVLIPALWLGTRWGGTVGAAVAHVITGLVVTVPLTVLALHRVGIRLAPLGRSLVRPLLGGAGSLVVCLLFAAIPGPALVRLLVAGLAGLTVFLATGIAPRDRRMAMNWLAPRLRTVLRRLPRRTARASV